jgi:hypothetical protein
MVRSSATSMRQELARHRVFTADTPVRHVLDLNNRRSPLPDRSVKKEPPIPQEIGGSELVPNVLTSNG